MSVKNTFLYLKQIIYNRFFEMSSIDAKWPKTLFATLKWHILNVGRILWKQWFCEMSSIDAK